MTIQIPHLARFTSPFAYCLLGLVILPFLSPAFGATITVTSTSGQLDPPGCTLRAAILAAETDSSFGGCPAGSGADTIILASGATYTLTEVADFTAGPNGLPFIGSTILIEGNGARILRASTAPDFRFFFLGGNLTVRDLSFEGGRAGLGDAVSRDGGVARFGGGSALFERCTFIDNSADADPGGDGGVFHHLSGSLEIINSTFFGNRASRWGGSIFSAAPLRVVHSTFVSNQAALGGAIGLLDPFSRPELLNSLFVGNTATEIGPDLQGDFISNGHNRVGTLAGSQGMFPSEEMSGLPLNAIIEAIPRNNGGLTPTLRLLPGSPAMDAGEVASSTPTDQRGQARVGLPDAGSFELAAGSLPRLYVPPLSGAIPREAIEIPVRLDPAGQAISSTAFSLDYDQNCLDPDFDHDGVLDHVTLAVPESFSTVVLFDPSDSDGEIDISIADIAPPLSTLPDGILLLVRFHATCTPTAGGIDAPLLFSSSPTATFGDDLGQDVSGTAEGGIVRIVSGLRGDCNGSLSLGSADLSAVGLEIFDGDGDFWFDAGNPTFLGSPVGCDANASTRITASDVACTNLLLFGNSCSPGEGTTPQPRPRLEVSTTFDGAFNWIGARLTLNGNAVGSLAFSLDLDPSRFDIGSIDSNNDGVPDHLRLPSGSPGLSFVKFSVEDLDGELDILLADLSFEALPEGLLVEIGVPSLAPVRREVKISKDPQPSFGSVFGRDIVGEVLNGNVLFSDGFESGTLESWSQTFP